MNNEIEYLFLNKYNSINKEIEFNNRWNIGCERVGKDLEYAYFDRMLNSEDRIQIAMGDIARCVEPYPCSRKIIVIGTIDGTLLVFNRYSNNYNKITTNVTNGSLYDKCEIPFGMLSIGDLIRLFNKYCIDDYCI